MTSGPITTFSVTKILRMEAPKSSGSDLPDTTQTLIGSTPIVEDILLSTNASKHKTSDEASNIPFSVEAILRLEPSNSAKHKPNDGRPKTPFSVEDILRLETSKSPKLKSNNEISKMPLSVEDIPESESSESTKLDNEAPKMHFSYEEVFRKEPIKASDKSKAHKLRAALTKSTECNDEGSCCSDYSCLSPCGPKVWIPIPAYRWQSFNQIYRDRIILHHNSENVSSSLNGDVENESFRPMTPGLLSRGKCQVRFTMEQTAALEKAFGDQRYISPEQRRIIAMQIQLSEKQVKTWFQNRRAKWKKQRLFSSGVDSTCYCGPSPKLSHI